MQHPLILISSAQTMGSLSISRQQSTLYGSCLAAVHAVGMLYSGADPSHSAARCDGLLLSGGGDLHPTLYGQQKVSDSLCIDPVRDKEEQALFEAFYRRRKPIFGICRGMQAINVFLGGTLHQDIPAHSNCCHTIRCTGALSALLDDTVRVNSYHHQSVDRIAPPLVASAHAHDGTIEALFHPFAPILGVQWHPERMVPPYCEDISSVNHLTLFRWLTERC